MPSTRSTRATAACRCSRWPGRRTLLNLAKNPTGFNQNIKIILQDERPKAVAFFVNDKEGDGRDVSWLWDIDFEELAQAGPLTAYAGGIRGRDMAVRLKYAGIDAKPLTTPTTCCIASRSSRKR